MLKIPCQHVIQVVDIKEAQEDFIFQQIQQMPAIIASIMGIQMKILMNKCQRFIQVYWENFQEFFLDA